MSWEELRASLRQTAQREKRHDGPLSIIGTMALLSAVAGILVAAIFIPGTALFASTANNVSNDIVNLPLELNDQPSAQTTRLLASNGDLIAYFYEENRQDIPLAKISPLMQEAILSIEDARFYEHGALDLKGTLRALVNNASEGQTQGGSSITQQLVKLTLVSQATTKKQRMAAIKKSTARKIRELKLAIQYEETHTKKEILERYLNLAYFGDSAYGISAASYHYFSVSPAKLNVRQAATLAGLVKNPVQFDPRIYPEKALARRNTVLAVMARLGKISEADAKRYQAAPLGLKVTKFPNGCVSTVAEFSCDYVRRYLLRTSALGATVADRQRALERGGLTIKSNIDVRMQKAVNKAVSETVAPKDGAIGAMALLEPGTGKVKGLAQSKPMGNNKKKGQSFINFTVPKAYGDSGGFPAGSTFKMFTDAAALKQGIDVGQTFKSPGKITMRPGSYFACNGGGTQVWEPENSTGNGTFNMYTGTRLSVNTYFAQLEKKAGLCNVVRAAESMGIKVPDRDQVGPFTLGVTNVSPLDMAAAYAVPASGGMYCKPLPIDSIVDANGKTIRKFRPNCERVMSKDDAAQINDILRGVQEPGGFGYDLGGTGLSIPSAAKTGTAQDNQSVWYAGYTPKLAAMAMIAGVKKNGSPKSLAGVTINGRFLDFHTVGGSSLAGPMWAKAMHVIEDFLPSVQFDTPPKTKPTAPKKEKKRPANNDTGTTTDGAGTGTNGPGNGTDGPGNGTDG
ncbi:transglycosylase domain-containing protein [Aeromicrobium ginsengisoli]|uniref:Penicillin-binding protein n=1 Tax=Aeromicrobium ginsengisoli TaxID=363867 RepID=A0A5M4FCF7_9ACTN|nr:transglycosylase domain-containing protein [Aeromicrobium ginsengisoli]KAA1396036.1 penicillin-binding protein [Aeromicrobium ginsengisoli]